MAQFSGQLNGERQKENSIDKQTTKSKLQRFQNEITNKHFAFIWQLFMQMNLKKKENRKFGWLVWTEWENLVYNETLVTKLNIATVLFKRKLNYMIRN